MKAIVFTGRNEVNLTELSDPRPATGEVVIAVKASGVCHTDFEILKDNYGTGAFPVVPGHEYAGTVVEISAGVETVKVGDRIVVDPNIECGVCRSCQRGWANLCEKLRAYGVTTDGGFAELNAVRADRVYAIGDLRFCHAALAEPIGCVLNGLNAVHARCAESALIFGAGPMGLLLGLCLRAEGVSEVILCDIDSDRLKLAQDLGFDALASSPSDLLDLQKGFTLVADATGEAEVASQLPTYMANGGKGLIFGVCPSNARISVSPFELFRRQLTLVGSHSLNHNIPEALERIRVLGSNLDPIVSHRLSLKDVAKLFKSDAPKGSLKVQWCADA